MLTNTGFLWHVCRIAGLYSCQSTFRVCDSFSPPCSDIHVTDADAQAESGLTVADRRLLIGALEYKEKRCAWHNRCPELTSKNT